MGVDEVEHVDHMAQQPEAEDGEPGVGPNGHQGGDELHKLVRVLEEGDIAQAQVVQGHARAFLDSS